MSELDEDEEFSESSEDNKMASAYSPSFGRANSLDTSKLKLGSASKAAAVEDDEFDF